MLKKIIKKLLRPLYRAFRYNDFFANIFLCKIKKRYNGVLLYDLCKRNKYKKALRFITHSKLIGPFYYNINTNLLCKYSATLIDNIPVDYSLILENSLSSLFSNFYDQKACHFISNVLDSAILDTKNEKRTNAWLLDFKNKKCSHFDEALQRILFINSILWQTGHCLNGLGRLDQLLIEYYRNDIREKYLTEKEASDCILYFMKALHRDYHFKSNSLKGDTGQIIICGGVNSSGLYLANELTYLFLLCNKQMKTPDPKILLRVSNKMPVDLLELALECIQQTGGSPLLSNDDVVIKSMISYGYEKNDSYNYATSACWEPLVCGCSADPNNIGSFDFLKCLQKATFKNPSSYNELILFFKESIKEELENIINVVNSIMFAYDPIMSLFINDCAQKKKDVSVGGARYNDFGILTAGLGNSINAIININELVYKNKTAKLSELIEEANDNFANDSHLYCLKNDFSKYGMDEAEIIELSNEIIDYMNSLLKLKKNSLGGGFKFGLSSPGYLVLGKNDPASLDGRKANMPLDTHISSQKQIPYTELFNFASSLKYEGANVNGNVVDFLVTPTFIKDNFDKFVLFIQTAIKKGFFQTQMNIIDSETLIKAKNHPEEYRNLIVRVWGFSAYFVELPVEYQNVLIDRALANEGVSK